MWGYDLLHFLLFFFSLKLCVFRYCGCPFHFQYKDNMISHTILIFTSQDLGLEKSESQKCMSFLPSYWRYPYYYVPHLQNVCSNKCFGRFDLTLSTIKVQIASPLIQCRIFWRRKNYFPPSTYHHMFKSEAVWQEHTFIVLALWFSQILIFVLIYLRHTKDIWQNKTIF